MQYKSDKYTTRYDTNLKTNSKYLYNIIVCLIPFYYAICIVIPFIFEFWLPEGEGIELCSKPIDSISYGIYGSFAFITMVIELLLYKQALNGI